MRNWRIISTVAAVVFAAVAGVLVWKYLTSADTRAERKKDLVTVLVAKSNIPRGMLFDQVLADKLFQTTKIPKDSLPPDRVAPDTDAKLLAVYQGKVAVSPIFAGTPIVSDEFVESSQLVSTVAGAIPKGRQAITVSLDQTHAVGGFVTPGDRVNIILNFSASDSNGAGAGKDHKVTAFLLPGLKVIAVGSTTILPSTPANATPAAANGPTTTTSPQTQPSSLITLQVTPREAEQIVQATELGTVWLSLDPPDFTPGQFKSPSEIVDEINLFNQPLTEAQRRVLGFPQDLPVPSEATP